VERLILKAKIEQAEARFVARVEGIDVQAEGYSPDVAREELIQAMLSWISTKDCTDSMGDALAEAGFPAIDDETELQLEFADHSADSAEAGSPEAGLYSRG